MDKIAQLKELAKSKSGEDKVKALNDLAFALYNYNPEKTEKYARQALTLSHKINSKHGIARSYNVIGISFHRRGDFAKAREFYFSALEMFQALDDKRKIAASLNNIGATYEKLGIFDLSLKYHLDAFKIWEDMDDKKNLAASCNNIGIIYEKQGSYESALEYHLKSMQLKEEIDDKRGTAISFNNLGIVYERLHKLEEAVKYHMKALKIKEEIGDKHSIAVSYLNIGNIFAEQDQQKTAMDYFEKALKYLQEIDDKFGVATTSTSIGVIHTELKNYDLAHQNLKKSLQLSREIGAKKIETNALKSYSSLYEAEGDISKALQYNKKYLKLFEELFNEQKSKQIAEMQARFETNTKEKIAEIYRLKNVELAGANEQLIKEISERKSAEEEIMLSRKRLQIINQMLRHDLTNDLTVIKSALRLYKINSDELMITEMEDRVSQSLLMIKRLRDQENFLDSHSYLNEMKLTKIFDKLIDKYPELEFNVNGSGSVFVDESIFSVFDNLVINSITHGESKRIDISITDNEKYYQVKFKDYGTGIPLSIKDKIFDEGFVHGSKGHTGIGLYIVRQTIDSYGGFINLESNEADDEQTSIGATFVMNLRKAI
jgi:signal transduction histidine kinase/Tfp pilus assembly protein PilF